LNFVYQVVIGLDLDEIDKKVQKRLKNNLAVFKEEKLQVENKNGVKSAVIVGTGPAGLFAAYLLAKKGVKVTLIERGKPVDERVKDIEELHKKRSLK